MLFLVTLLAVACNPQQEPEEQSPQELIKSAMEFSATKLEALGKATPDLNTFPRSTAKDGSYVTTGGKGWTSGFYPGSLWYMYEYTGDEKWAAEAQRRTEPLTFLKDYEGTHDLGFMIGCSFGQGLRLKNIDGYEEIMIDGANSLISRFDPNTGLIRSWDHGDWMYPVIIDNMMNLEFLFWATEVTGDSTYYDICISHADSTMKHHYRDDWSTWHVIDYDTITGQPGGKGTHQGYSDESSWSRGQAWGLYGYTVMYRVTKDKKYLDLAVNIADYILNHPNMPEDLVPYWDYDAPGIPNEERDASAAALHASALLELYNYVEDGTKYYNAAVQTIESLASPKYSALNEKNNNFILMHSTGNKNGGKEIDVPLVYADYYYIEALMRYKDSLEK